MVSLPPNWWTIPRSGESHAGFPILGRLGEWGRVGHWGGPSGHRGGFGLLPWSRKAFTRADLQPASSVWASRRILGPGRPARSSSVMSVSWDKPWHPACMKWTTGVRSFKAELWHCRAWLALLRLGKKKQKERPAAMWGYSPLLEFKTCLIHGHCQG